MSHISYPAKVVHEQLRTGTTNLKQAAKVTAKSVGNKAHTQTLFKNLHGAYGQCWANRFDSPAMAEAVLKQWSQDLSIYAEAEVDRAFEVCKKRYLLAPTLPQFLELCKTARDSKYVRPANTGVRSNEAFAQPYLAQIRQTLKKNGGGCVRHSREDTSAVATTAERDSETNSEEVESAVASVDLGWEEYCARCDGGVE